jgi:hypothetical protein
MSMRPLYLGLPSQTISVGIASAATLLNGASSQGPRQIELQNAGSVPVFVAFGSSGVTTSVAAGYPVLAGQSKVVSIPPNASHIATISGTASQTLYITQGEGF